MEKFKLPNIEEEQSVLKTIRIKYSTLKKLEELSKESDLSINRIINECIEFALNNLESKPIQNEKWFLFWNLVCFFIKYFTKSLDE